MTLADTVKQDLTSAMKAGEKERVGALRLVLSELQKAAKEGKGDELAVLRRERKRRHESATAFRDGRPRRPRRGRGVRGRRSSRPTCRPSCPTTSCARSSRDAVAETGAASPKDMGQVMKAAMARSPGAPTASACPRWRRRTSG